jgi:hypothetical protein
MVGCAIGCSHIHTQKVELNINKSTKKKRAAKPTQTKQNKAPETTQTHTKIQMSTKKNKPHSRDTAHTQKKIRHAHTHTNTHTHTHYPVPCTQGRRQDP